MPPTSHILHTAAALALFLTACAPHRQHQRAWPETRVTDTSGKTATHDQVAVIEFDSNGTFWDTKQLDKAVEMVKDTPRPPLLITFIHGWRHDARPGDADLRMFTKFIEQLNQNRPMGLTARGLFIGWRGASIDESSKYLSWLTTPPAVCSFWSIKHGTGRVASRVDLNRAINQTAAAAWARSGRTAIVGHSFGGRILELISSNFASGQSGGIATFKPMADLVVLINPASESLNARQTKLALQAWDKSYPLTVTLGATNDGPNRSAWPIGYFLAPQPLIRTYDPLHNGGHESQRGFLNTTVANDPRQITHTLTPDSPLPPASSHKHGFSTTAKKSASAASAKTLTTSALAANLKIDPAQATRAATAAHAPSVKLPVWISDADPAKPARLYTLQGRKDTDVQGVDYVLDSKAYWTLQVPLEVLSGHSGNRKADGVLAQPVTDLLAAIFTYTCSNQTQQGPPVVKTTTAQDVKTTSLKE